MRSVVARYEYCSAAVMDILARDPQAEIRLEVAKNWNTSLATLQRLTQDAFPEVANIAANELTKRQLEKNSE